MAGQSLQPTEREQDDLPMHLHPSLVKKSKDGSTISSL